MPTVNLNSFKESDAQNSSTKSHREVKEGFRVRVSLERFFSDERSRAYVYVVQHRPVRWLQQHLRTLFGLKGLFCLCSNGYFLPPEEPLSILQPNDPVEVIPSSDDILNSANRYSRNNFLSNKLVNSHNINNAMETSNHSEEAPVRGTEGIAADEDKQLLCMKQQALALLETQCEDAASAECESGRAVHSAGEGDRARRTRRRVRRRKRHLSGGDSTVATGERETNEDTNKSVVQSTLEYDVCSRTEGRASAEDLVKRMEDEERARDVGDDSMDTRKARLVRSISPPQT